MPRELAPVAEKSDALMRKLDAALRRERRTTADIAHELRTPISEVLTVSEVALRDVQDVEATRKALRVLRNVAWRMGRSVTTLLKLARLEMGAEAFACAPVDLGAIVSEALRSLNALERERALSIHNEVARGTLVDGDADVLRIIVTNLLSNAVYYAPRESRVTCRYAVEDAGWRFVVENVAVDLQREDLGALVEPFWRKDKSRSDPNRSGLGLALSGALAESAGISLGFELENELFRATLSSPSEAPDRASSAA